MKLPTAKQDSRDKRGEITQQELNIGTLILGEVMTSLEVAEEEKRLQDVTIRDALLGMRVPLLRCYATVLALSR